MRAPVKLLVTALASVSLAGCAYGGMGLGYDGGYGSPYGYGGYGGYGNGVSVGIGVGSGYGGGYGYPGYGYGYGYDTPWYNPSYGSPYWGWYGDSYYPGTGYYVYDRARQPHRWSDNQRNYWMQRQQAYRSNSTKAGSQPVVRENWRDFPRNRDMRPMQNGRRDTSRADEVSDREKR